MANYKSKPYLKFTLIIPIIIGAAILTTSAVKVSSPQLGIFEKTFAETEKNLNSNSETTSNTFITPITNYKRTPSGWGFRIHPIHKTKAFHEGIDFTANINTPVLASQSGIVPRVSTDNKGYGKRIELEHTNGYKTLYAHLNEFNVTEGQKVHQGDIIGLVGKTGKATAPHLHFEIHENGKKINPLTLINIKSSKNKNQDKIPNSFYSPIKKEELTKVSSGYGMRKHPITKEMKQHNGVDYVAPINTEILAIGDGTVRKVNHTFEEGKGYGRFVIVDHKNGYSSLYSQLNAYKVKEGQKVKAGDIIGLLGSSGMSTGPHLHLEIKKDGQFIDPESVIK